MPGFLWDERVAGIDLWERRKTEVMQPQVNNKIAESPSPGIIAPDMNDQCSNMDEFLRKIDANWSTFDSLRAKLDQ